MYFQWDNYHLKLGNPVRIMVCSFEPPLRGNVRYACGTLRERPVIKAFSTCNTVPVTLELFNCR